MIFNGIQCTVYEPTELELSLAMVKRIASNGKPTWTDYGASYDTATIKTTITSTGDNRALLEAVVREQFVGDYVIVCFEAGEFLYEFSHGFTIQKFDLIKDVANRLEYGYEVELSPVTPINWSALAGDRTTNCASMAYGTANIEPPKEFKPKYNTKKYAGQTNGSSYSSELPTNEYDSTKWTSQMVLNNARGLVDMLTTTRGSAFFCTFQNNSYPFGIHSGDITGQRLCVTSQKNYTIKLVRGYIYSIELEVYAL